MSASANTITIAIPSFSDFMTFCLQKLRWIALTCIVLPIAGGGPELANAMATRLVVKVTGKPFFCDSSMSNSTTADLHRENKTLSDRASDIGYLFSSTYEPIDRQPSSFVSKVIFYQKKYAFAIDTTPLAHITLWSMAKRFLVLQIGYFMGACILWVICHLPQIRLTYRELYDYFRLPPGAIRALTLLTPGEAPIFPFLCTYMGCFCFYSGTLYLMALGYAYWVASREVWTKEKKRLLALGTLHLLVALLEYRKRDHIERQAWIVYHVLFVAVHLTWTATEHGGLRRVLQLVVEPMASKPSVVQALLYEHESEEMLVG